MIEAFRRADKGPDVIKLFFNVDKLERLLIAKVLQLAMGMSTIEAFHLKILNKREMLTFLKSLLYLHNMLERLSLASIY
jgi:hypothetical protein